MRRESRAPAIARSLVSTALLAAAALACGKGIWNASDLAEWVRKQAVKQGCDRTTIELEPWYRSDADGNAWHGRCDDRETRARMDFAIDVDGVWKRSSSE